jgi:ABC-type glycerol-3-phosphate transport system permease component
MIDVHCCGSTPAEGSLPSRLPQQVIITPLYRLFLLAPVPGLLSETGVLFDSYVGIIVIHVAFQMGLRVIVRGLTPGTKG